MVPNNTLELKESFKSFLVDTKLLVTQSEIVKSLVGLNNVKDQYTNCYRTTGFAFLKFFLSSSKALDLLAISKYTSI